MEFMRMLLLASALLLIPLAAHAQVGPRSAPPAQAGAPAAPAPSAVPGSRPNHAAAPRQSNAELRPNEALFDAINRGDLGDARGALNRGAQLDARNILGLTPLELAIDLGRNDIAFLLLSMRQGHNEDRRATPPRDEAPQRATRRPSLAAPPVSRASSPPATPATPRLWSNDGGTAQPDDGFLGFDANRPAGERNTRN